MSLPNNSLFGDNIVDDFSSCYSGVSNFVGKSVMDYLKKKYSLRNFL